MTLTRHCSACGLALVYVWITVFDVVLCLACGTDQTIVTRVLTEKTP